MSDQWMIFNSYLWQWTNIDDFQMCIMCLPKTIFLESVLPFTASAVTVCIISHGGPNVYTTGQLQIILWKYFLQTGCLQPIMSKALHDEIVNSQTELI